MGKREIHLNRHTISSVCSAAMDRMSTPLEEIRLSDIERAYQIIYEMVGACSEDTFILTSSAAEAVNQLFWSLFLDVARKKGKCHFIASALEDAPTMQMLKRLEDLGCFVKFVGVNGRGQIDLEELRALISPRTALISVTAAHGLTGVIQPVEEIASIAQEKGVLLHIDGAHALGKYDFSSVRADYLTFSGERLHAGISGGLFVKKGAPLSPLIVGGAEQGGFRGGSFDLRSLMALSAAASQISLGFDGINLEMARLRDLLEKEVQLHLPETRVAFKETLRLPNTTTLLFPGAHYQALFYLLERKGIMAAIGGAYSQHLHRILAASGIGGESALSFSLDRMTTEEEILAAAPIIAQEARLLCSLSEDL
jgi:cysteine desulfurase